jgi:hypothetical protein
MAGGRASILGWTAIARMRDWYEQCIKYLTLKGMNPAVLTTAGQSTPGQSRSLVQATLHAAMIPSCRHYPVQ